MIFKLNNDNYKFKRQPIIITIFQSHSADIIYKFHIDIFIECHQFDLIFLQDPTGV